ncbi:hypothetical protein [Rhizobium sp. BK696]|uniref:hypothetical protein n=1 Tax=Rhizobium sp. Rhizsp82 TaxID=3243057 RepID=UPI0010E21A39
MPSTIPYEPDMIVFYDSSTRSVVVAFRGKLTFLGPFFDKPSAYEAAEDFCRSRGWKG